MSIPVIICGAFGRMGRACIELGLGMPEFNIKGATKKPGSDHKAPQSWPFAIKESLDFDAHAVIIDFSHSNLTPDNLAQAKKNKWPLLIATTGHTQNNFTAMKEASAYIPVLYAPNTSIMANLLIKLSALAARICPASAHITDVHHKDKKDAPSGTALALEKALAAHMSPHDISINSVRVADVVGEHTLSLFKKNERLEISHRVSDREIFAEGALIAAQFLYNAKPGLYDMIDVLNLK